MVSKSRSAQKSSRSMRLRPAPGSRRLSFNAASKENALSPTRILAAGRRLVTGWAEGLEAANGTEGARCMPSASRPARGRTNSAEVYSIVSRAAQRGPRGTNRARTAGKTSSVGGRFLRACSSV